VWNAALQNQVAPRIAGDGARIAPGGKDDQAPCSSFVLMLPFSRYVNKCNLIRRHFLQTSPWSVGRWIDCASGRPCTIGSLRQGNWARVMWFKVE
jgi:hypothetical protein